MSLAELEVVVGGVLGCDPRSAWAITPATVPPRAATAMVTSEPRSSTDARYSQPSPVGM
jgi:hypothetical protein